MFDWRVYARSSCVGGVDEGRPLNTRLQLRVAQTQKGPLPTPGRGRKRPDDETRYFTSEGFINYI